MDKEMKKEFEELAVMINAGFNSMQEQMDKRFERVETEIADVRTELADTREELKQEISAVKETMARREDYYIEEVGDIKRRVDRIEDHVGIPHGASA